MQTLKITKAHLNETKITCGKLVSGEICYGDLVELGLPDEKQEYAFPDGGDIIEQNGVKYKRMED